MKKLFFIALLLTSAFLFNACEKDLLTEIEANYEGQSSKNDFFDIYFAANNHPYLKNTSAGKTDDHLADTLLLQTIIDDLLLKETQNPFVDQLTKLAGYPIWQQAVTLYDSTQQRQIAWIPLAKLSSHRTNALLMCVQQNNRFYYTFTHCRYNKTLLAAADSVNLSADEITYRQQTEKVTNYFDADLFGNGVSSGWFDFLSTFRFIVICIEFECTDMECCDMFSHHTHVVCYDLGGISGGSSSGGGSSGSGFGEGNSGNNSSGSSSGSGAGGNGSGSSSSSPSSSNDAYSDFWSQVQGLEYHEFMQNLNDFIEANNIALVPESEAWGSGYSFNEIYHLAIENDCINAPFNDYISGSAFDNCLWEAMYVNYNATQALSDFNHYMGLEISQAAFDILTQDCSDIGTNSSFLECAKMAYARQKHAELITQYENYATEFSQAGFTSIDAFIEVYGLERYLSAVVIYEAMHAPDAWWEMPDEETLHFYIEMFSAELLPLGITFVPYGIGDIADIYLSCGEASWGCALAIVGILVPFDELVDMWRKSDQIKAAWKAVKNHSALKAAWKFIENCPKSIRTNPQILDGIRIALQRGLKTVNEVVTHANVPYIDQATVQHIFRGDSGGGVHHISALIADQTTYKLVNRTPTSNGCYRAIVEKNGVNMYSPHPDGKSFFPDEWSEEQVIDAIKEAYGNSSPLGGSKYSGTGLGINILFYKATDGRIISAFPNY